MFCNFLRTTVFLEKATFTAAVAPVAIADTTTSAAAITAATAIDTTARELVIYNFCAGNSKINVPPCQM